MNLPRIFLLSIWLVVASVFMYECVSMLKQIQNIRFDGRVEWESIE